MDVTRTAAVVAVISIIILAVGVGLFDYRAGLITAGICGAAAGIWTLTQE